MIISCLDICTLKFDNLCNNLYNAFYYIIKLTIIASVYIYIYIEYMYIAYIYIYHKYNFYDFNNVCQTIYILTKIKII